MDNSTVIIIESIVLGAILLFFAFVMYSLNLFTKD